MDPHRPPARDDAQEDGPEREQDHKGDGRHDPVGGPAPHCRVVVEACAVPKAEAAVAVTIAVAVTAAAVARVPAAGISTIIAAAASPATKLGEGRVSERGCFSMLSASCIGSK